MERRLMRRRDLLVGAAALGMASPLAACATGAVSTVSPGAAKGGGADDARLAAMLERHAQALRAEEGGGDRLADYSLAARARHGQATAQRLAELGALNRAALSAAAALDYDTAR